MKRLLLIAALSTMIFTGCSKKEEGDYAFDQEDNYYYDWGDETGDTPVIIRDDEYETETGTEVETETETDTKVSLQDIMLTGVSSWETRHDVIDSDNDFEFSDIRESKPVVIDQSTCQHIYDQTGDSKDATCIKDGYIMYRCTNCGKSKTETVAATGHDFTTELIPPTCTEQGYTLQKCSKCNDSSKQNFTAVVPHNEEHTSIQAPTCTTEGIDEIRCSVCMQLLRYENVKVLGHTWEKTKEDQPCDEGAVIDYRCVTCGITKTDKLAGTHKFGSWKVETAATCTAEGKKIRTCAVCSYQESDEIAKVDHKAADWKTETAATCYTEGTRVKVCSVCNQTVEKGTIPKTAHVPLDWTETKEATCDKAGAETRVCSICRQTVETRATEKLPHTFKLEVKTEATCSEPGVRVQRCLKCYAEGEEQEIPATGHAYVVVSIVEPKCEVVGYKNYSCSKCGDTYAEEIAVLGHAYGSNDLCIRCGAIKSE